MPLKQDLNSQTSELGLCILAIDKAEPSKDLHCGQRDRPKQRSSHAWGYGGSAEGRERSGRHDVAKGQKVENGRDRKTKLGNRGGGTADPKWQWGEAACKCVAAPNIKVRFTALEGTYR